MSKVNDMSKVKNHNLDSYTMRCIDCNATYEAIMDNLVTDCKPSFKRCKECSLMRQCFGDTCNECRENMKFSNHLSSESGLTEASFEKMCADICNKPFEEHNTFIFGFGPKKDP